MENTIQLELFRSVKPCPRWIVRLLKSANSDPPGYSFKYAFYRIKDQLIEKHGVRDGVDYQLITHSCNRCDGTGNWGYWRDDGGEGCRKCIGTGVFKKFVVPLQRWKVGSECFHRPGERLEAPSDEQIEQCNIVGTIKHKPCPRSLDSFLWLALIFDKKLFWRAMRSSTLLNEGTRQGVMASPSTLLLKLHWLIRERNWRLRRLIRKSCCGKLRLWFQADCDCGDCIPF